DKAREALIGAEFEGRVITSSFLEPSAAAEAFDAAVGNPPFVRFQFVTEHDRQHIDALGRHLEVPFKGVSNLWIPILLKALGSLRDGGAFSFIVPTECFTGLAARAVRTWLGQHATRLRVD